MAVNSLEIFRRGEPPPPQPATGFYTDTTVCIGCKACEVACKQWNQLPADGFHWTGNSYDNTGELSATSWRHVKFVEQFPPAEASRGRQPPETNDRGLSLPVFPPVADAPGSPGRWLMMSDVCKHCVAAPCQHACPTASIQFGPVDELKERARRRVEELHGRGVGDAYLYGDAATEAYSALNSFYLLLDRPAVYGLPEKPVNPWLHMAGDYTRGAAGMLAGVVILLATILLRGP